MDNSLKIPLPVTLDNQETERLLFRKLIMTDLEELMPFFSSQEAMKFLPVSSMSAIENGETWINRQLNRYNTNGDGLYALINKETGKIVGMCGLIIQEVDEQKELEIGYHLLPEYWHNGYSTEASQFCKNFAQKHQLAKNVISLIDFENFNSQKVAERNDMSRGRATVFKGIPAYVYSVNL